MKHTHYRALLLSGVAMSLALPASAQQGGMALEEIVVTAQRREQNLSDVPISITAMEGRMLERLNIATTEGLSQFTPSLHIYAEAVGSEKYTIRGIGRTSEDLSADPGVAVFLNDIYVPRQAEANMAMFDVQRVEVLRGPQGTLYGKNATAGAINIITREPTEEPSGYLEAAYGSFDRVTVKGAVSGPLSDGKVYGRIAFNVDQRDGLYENLTTGESANNIDVVGGRATLKFTPSDALTVSVVGDWIRSKQDGVLKSIISDVPGLKYVFFTNNPVTGAPRPGVTPPTQEAKLRTARSGTNGRQGMETYGGLINLDYAADTFDFISITGARSEDSYLQEDNGRAKEVTSFGTTDEDTWSFSQEFRLVSNVPNDAGSENRLAWTVGAYYFHEEGTKQADTYRNVPPFSGIAKFTQRIDTDSYALFGEANYRVSDRVTVTAGVRYTTEKKELGVDGVATRIPGITANGPITPFINANFSTSDSKRWNRLSPRGVIDFEITDEAFVYASIAKGFKSGGFQGQPPAPPLREFSPEDVVNYEVGFKGEFMDRRFLFNASAFYSDYKNLQLQTFDVNGAPTTSTASAKSRGVELEIAALLTDRLTVRGGASLIDPEYKQFISQQPGFSDLAHTFDRSGKRIGGVPKHNFSLMADYVYPLDSAGTITFHGDIVSVDEIITEFGTLWGNAYTKGDVRITWENAAESWSVSGWVNNVTDKDYYRGGGPVAKYDTDKIRLGLINDPRTFGISTAFRF
ncbi:MAG: TonB-dependent receptor [Rhodobacteraceae bacterium]|nr:TonB-dependent receptor [Paracoccaceae bacterium]